MRRGARECLSSVTIEVDYGIVHLDLLKAASVSHGEDRRRGAQTKSGLYG